LGQGDLILFKWSP